MEHRICSEWGIHKVQFPEQFRPKYMPSKLRHNFSARCWTFSGNGWGFARKSDCMLLLQHRQFSLKKHTASHRPERKRVHAGRSKHHMNANCSRTNGWTNNDLDISLNNFLKSVVMQSSETQRPERWNCFLLRTPFSRLSGGVLLKAVPQLICVMLGTAEVKKCARKAEHKEFKVSRRSMNRKFHNSIRQIVFCEHKIKLRGFVSSRMGPNNPTCNQKEWSDYPD